MQHSIRLLLLWHAILFRWSGTHWIESSTITNKHINDNVNYIAKTTYARSNLWCNIKYFVNSNWIFIHRRRRVRWPFSFPNLHWLQNSQSRQKSHPIGFKAQLRAQNHSSVPFTPSPAIKKGMASGNYHVYPVPMEYNKDIEYWASWDRLRWRPQQSLFNVSTKIANPPSHLHYYKWSIKLSSWTFYFLYSSSYPIYPYYERIILYLGVMLAQALCKSNELNWIEMHWTAVLQLYCSGRW